MVKVKFLALNLKKIFNFQEIQVNLTSQTPKNQIFSPEAINYIRYHRAIKPVKFLFKFH